jgi:hypothetical protein
MKQQNDDLLEQNDLALELRVPFVCETTNVSKGPTLRPYVNEVTGNLTIATRKHGPQPCERAVIRFMFLSPSEHQRSLSVSVSNFRLFGSCGSFFPGFP